jgi:rfaE bifunctional protein nucleotidyltransferase chain/domain
MRSENLQRPEAGPPTATGRQSREKIGTVADIAMRVRAEQSAGAVVVLAHGVFDLVHLGHVRHLDEARRNGDVLVVTVTADRFVNKGPGRPVFSAHLRAQMLAALENVDYVAISETPTAVDVLRTIRPDVYIKGPDYANAADDITGGISAEREAVESYGGRIAFTDDITFSSSTLINKFLGVHDSQLQTYLEEVRAADSLGSILRAVESVANMRVLIVGDTIIDEYKYVSPMAKSPKENMIATLFQSREVFAGGVIAAANHTASFCKSVDILTAVGAHESFEDLIRESLKPNVSFDCVRRPGKPTTRKTRFVEPGYMRKLFEMYVMEDQPLDEDEEALFLRALREKIAEYDLVIVCDFGHGLITPAVVDALERGAKFLAVNTQTNSANLGYNLVTRYRRADYVCIDAPEARLAVGDKFGDIETIASRSLRSRVACDRLVITHGKNGCITFDSNVGTHRIPAFTGSVVDTVGAGDAFLAVTSPLVAAGTPMNLVGFIGNAAGAMKVGIVGHRTSIERVPLTKFVTAILK